MGLFFANVLIEPFRASNSAPSISNFKKLRFKSKFLTILSTVLVLTFR